MANQDRFEQTLSDRDYGALLVKIGIRWRRWFQALERRLGEEIGDMLLAKPTLAQAWPLLQRSEESLMLLDDSEVQSLF